VEPSHLSICAYIIYLNIDVQELKNLGIYENILILLKSSNTYPDNFDFDTLFQGVNLDFSKWFNSYEFKLLSLNLKPTITIDIDSILQFAYESISSRSNSIPILPISISVENFSSEYHPIKSSNTNIKSLPDIGCKSTYSKGDMLAIHVDYFNSDKSSFKFNLCFDGGNTIKSQFINSLVDLFFIAYYFILKD
jgi:hypothetical protein